MSKTYIVLDVPNLCYRGWHAASNIYPGRRKLTPQPLFRDLIFLRNTLDCSDFVFCFDHEILARKEHYPEYKANRQETEERKTVHRQIDLIRTQILPDIGFKNVLYKEGWEADDLMGALCRDVDQRKDTLFLVSTDTDLYQLLRVGVFIWDPIRKFTKTESYLVETYGIMPREWVRYKAIIGDGIDNIKGIIGVGQVTATKHLKGEVAQEGVRGKGNAALSKLDSEESQRIIKRNIPLVTLPYPCLDRTPILLHKDSITKENWKAAMLKHDIPSLADKFYGD